VPKRSPKLPPEFDVSIGGKRRPRVNRAREIFAQGTKTFHKIAIMLAEEFECSLDVARMDIASMIREMAHEQMELRPHQKTIALANFEAAFHGAMAAGKFSAAIRAMELHAKISGVLALEETKPEQPKLDFGRISAEQRAQFRETLQLVGEAQIAAARTEAQA
jgi:beta-glucosidase/6-phospho-beta-glucosidase/beta-galactosidase